MNEIRLVDLTQRAAQAIERALALAQHLHDRGHTGSLRRLELGPDAAQPVLLRPAPGRGPDAPVGNRQAHRPCLFHGVDVEAKLDRLLSRGGGRRDAPGAGSGSRPRMTRKRASVAAAPLFAEAGRMIVVTAEEMRAELTTRYTRVSMADMVRAMDEWFPGESFALRHLFLEERRHILAIVTRTLLDKHEEAYRRIWNESRKLVHYLRDVDAPIPEALRLVARHVLEHHLVEDVWIRIAKPQAPLAEEVEEVAVEITRSREDLGPSHS